MRKYLLIIALLVMISMQLAADCDMTAMLAKEGQYISWFRNSLGSFNDPYDFFTFIKNNSSDTTNDDGYGILYYPEDWEFHYGELTNADQAWYQEGEDTYYTNPTDPDWQDAMDDAQNYIMNNSTEASIFLAHARQGTGGDGNHPFRFTYDGQVYSFEHNGFIEPGVKEALHYELGGATWFNNHPSNWVESSDYSDYTKFIDSELIFHYIMMHVIDFDGDIIRGINSAFSQTSIGETGNEIDFKNEISADYDNNIINFILSDDEFLYAYRNSSSSDSDHNLQYKESDDFIGVKTGDSPGFSDLQQHYFYILSPYCPINSISNFHSVPSVAFFSGDITSNTTWDSTYPPIITDDVTVNSNVTLSISSSIALKKRIDFDVIGTVNINSNGILNLTGGSALNIDGTVNINNNGELKMDNSSEVIVDGTGALLKLNWGSTLSGSTETTYGASYPNQPGAGEKIPGDRVIAQYGGSITTNDNDTPGLQITIKSNSSDKWDGILITDPNNLQSFWLTNCDISGIDKLEINNPPGNRQRATLKLYDTDFHDSNQIIIRDANVLEFIGSSSDKCMVQNNATKPICSYESTVIMEYVHIGGETANDGEENSDGIYLYETGPSESIIDDCNVYYNSGNGIKIDDMSINSFANNDISYNTGHGMYCLNGGFFIGTPPIEDLTISNNGLVEYIGTQDTYAMGSLADNINISDSNFGSGCDNYLLWNINWDQSTPVDIRGTNIISSQISHLYPSNASAWTFGRDNSPESELMLIAKQYIGEEDYENAVTVLKSIIGSYQQSNEAVAAINFLYQIENLTDYDFTSLRNYLIALAIESSDFLFDAVQSTIGKTYMKDNNYAAAIDCHEYLINHSQNNQVVLSAMIDQGYCYLLLSESNVRDIPTDCTVKTSTFDSYQQFVNDLDERFDEFKQDSINETMPDSSILSHTNHPNPFNPETVISFNLSAPSKVNLSIYNIRGQKVKTLLNKNMKTGTQSVIWDGIDNNGRSVTSGIYFYKLSNDNETVTKKMLLLK